MPPQLAPSLRESPRASKSNARSNCRISTLLPRIAAVFFAMWSTTDTDYHTRFNQVKCSPRHATGRGKGYISERTFASFYIVELGSLCRLCTFFGTFAIWWVRRPPFRIIQPEIKYSGFLTFEGMRAFTNKERVGSRAISARNLSSFGIFKNIHKTKPRKWKRKL